MYNLTNPACTDYMAELIAEKWGISREAQDEYAVMSHHRAAAATADGHLTRQIVPAFPPPKRLAEGASEPPEASRWTRAADTSPSPTRRTETPPSEVHSLRKSTRSAGLSARNRFQRRRSEFRDGVR